MASDPARVRGAVLTTLAILMGLLAISNFSKPLQQASNGTAGFVFLGQRLTGMANAIVGPLFGVLLAAYAYGVWTMRRWVVPLAFGYALYVIANLILFSRTLPPEQRGTAFGLIYLVIAIGVSSGGALYLYANRRLLG